MIDTPFSAPLDFELFNDDGEPNLLLTDEPGGQHMTLILTNDSAEQIEFGDTNDHHFELVFRPGTLATTDNIQVDTSGYAMANAPVTHPDGTLSISIKSELLRVWNVKEEITLSGLKAEAGIGTRSTRIMLRYQNLKHAAGDFTGHLETQIHIVNSIGRINIPLQAGFVGDNHVLNDGSTENTLTLRLTNPLRLQKAIRGGDRARLVLVIAAGPKEEEWTLGTSSQVDGIRIHTLDNSGERTTVFHAIPGVLDLPAYDAEIKHNERSIEFRTLEPGAFMDIEVSNIITGHPTSHTQLILHYENIPGYRDGQFVLVVEKSPLVIEEGKVAIGPAQYKANFNVYSGEDGRGLGIQSASAGNTWLPWSNNLNYISGHGLILRDHEHKRKIWFDLMEGKVGIGTNEPSGMVHVSSGASGHCDLILEADVEGTSAGDAFHPRILFRQDGGQDQSAVLIEGNRLTLSNSVSSGGGIVFKTGTTYPFINATERMRISDGGDVGIGTNNPKGKMHIVHREEASDGSAFILGLVTGASLHMGYHQDYCWIQSHGNKPLAINALGKNVGIGTTDPEGNLHVSSAASGHCDLILEADVEGTSAGDAFHPRILFRQDGGQDQSAVLIEGNRLTLSNSVSSGGGIIFKTGTTHPFTNATERMKITSDGKVGIGVDSPSAKLHIIHKSENSNGSALVIGPVGNNSNLRLGYHSNYSWIQSHGSKPLVINAIGNNVGVGTKYPKKKLHVGNPSNHTWPGIRLDGKVWKSKRHYWDIVLEANDKGDQDLHFFYNTSMRGWVDSNSGAFKSNSDRSLKENIKPLGPVLGKVCQLEPKTYTWKENSGKDRNDEMMGFIAQEVEELFPEIVKEKLDKKSLGYTDFGVLAIGAIREQQETIDALNEKVETQQNMLEQLMKRLEVLEGKID